MRFYGPVPQPRPGQLPCSGIHTQTRLVSVFTGLPVSAAASALDFIRGVRLVYEVMVVLVIVGAIASGMRGRERRA
jgi:hypothetical protein